MLPCAGRSGSSRIGLTPTSSCRSTNADESTGSTDCAGADDLLLKPIDREELTVRLEIAQRILGVHLRLEQANRRLAELSRTDELTGLANRREFERQFATSLAMASRQRAPLSLMLLDIDHFKAFNDTFGHPVGDSALREFATAVRATSRHFECPARLGGEEFGMVLFGAAPKRHGRWRNASVKL